MNLLRKPDTNSIVLRSVLPGSKNTFQLSLGGNSELKIESLPGQDIENIAQTGNAGMELRSMGTEQGVVFFWSWSRASITFSRALSDGRVVKYKIVRMNKS